MYCMGNRVWCWLMKHLHWKHQTKTTFRSSTIPALFSQCATLCSHEETNTPVCFIHPNDTSVRDAPKNIPVTFCPVTRLVDNSVVTLTKQKRVLHMKDRHYNPSMTRLLSRLDYVGYHQLETVQYHVIGLLYLNTFIDVGKLRFPL